jgi:hypothetical protein
MLIKRSVAFMPQSALASHVRTLLTLSLVAGCSGQPGRVETPGVDADDAAQAALELYDENGNGELDGSELAASPSLTNASPSYDGNKDGSLSQAELVAGMQSWSQRGIGALSLPFLVRLNGRPLEGAQIKLIPEPFLADAVKPASGVSDGAGAGSLSIAEADRPSGFPKNLPVMQPGLYLVEITHPTVTIPPAYNASTTLGIEAGIAGQNPSGVTWDLQSAKK